MRLLAKVAIVAALLLAPQIASAQGTDEAVQRFERGVSLFEAQNYEGALVEFNAAYKLSGNYKLLYNIGICQQLGKDYVAATESFRKYLREGGSDVSPEKKADVEGRLQTLSLSVARVRVSTDAPAGTTLNVDDAPIGQVPLPDLATVKIGKRTFSLSAGGRTVTKTVEIASGDNPAVTLSMADAVGPATGAPPAERPIAPVDSGPSFPVVPWAITVLLGGAATVTGVLAVGKANDFQTDKSTYGVSQSTLDDDRSKARTMALVTDILLGCTIVSAGVSTFFTIKWAGAKGEKTAIVVTPSSVGLARSF